MCERFSAAWFVLTQSGHGWLGFLSFSTENFSWIRLMSLINSFRERVLSRNVAWVKMVGCRFMTIWPINWFSSASYCKNVAAANTLSTNSRSPCPSSWKLKTILSRTILSRTKWGKNSLNRSLYTVPSSTHFLNKLQKNLNTAPETKGKIPNMNILSSVSPKACISSSLLTSRIMASGSSADREGIFCHNSTRTGTEMSLVPTWELLPGFWGPPFCRI